MQRVQRSWIGDKCRQPSRMPHWRQNHCSRRLRCSGIPLASARYFLIAVVTDYLLPCQLLSCFAALFLSAYFALCIAHVSCCCTFEFHSG